MTELTKRATVYLEPDLHRALKLKAVETYCSISELVNEALRENLLEDAEDLASFRARENEPLMTFEEFVRYLRNDGKILGFLLEGRSVRILRGSRRRISSALLMPSQVLPLNQDRHNPKNSPRMRNTDCAAEPIESSMRSVKPNSLSL